MSSACNLTGLTSGRLHVIGRGVPTAKVIQGTYWLCRCRCGAEVTVKAAALLHSTRPTRSCGCLRREAAARRKRHGHAAGNLSPTYRAWVSMLNRCRGRTGTALSHYVSRGITACDRWLDFANFLADMGERPAGTTLDRINNDGNYEPGNCRWASRAEQARNKRNSLMVTFRGQTRNVHDWAESLGVRAGTLKMRIKRWGVERALSALPPPTR